MWHALWVERIDAKMARLREEQAQQAKAEERRIERAPEWIVELSIGQGGQPIEVHRGDCYAAGKRRRDITGDEARQKLVEGVRACTHCRPDTELGVLE